MLNENDIINIIICINHEIDNTLKLKAKKQKKKQDVVFLENYVEKLQQIRWRMRNVDKIITRTGNVVK